MFINVSANAVLQTASAVSSLLRYVWGFLIFWVDLPIPVISMHMSQCDVSVLEDLVALFCIQSRRLKSIAPLHCAISWKNCSIWTVQILLHPSRFIKRTGKRCTISNHPDMSRITVLKVSQSKRCHKAQLVLIPNQHVGLNTVTSNQ